jgi:cytochrome c peroxidase
MQSTSAVLRSLSLSALGPIPADSTNRVADDEVAAQLGRALFFEPRLSRSGTISCATCHDPNRLFTDGLAKARGEGATARNTPDLVGVGYRPWLYWDGRRDSLWSQALIPLEAPDEMGGSRLQTLSVVATDDGYRDLYERAFGAMPDLTGLAERAGPLGAPEDVALWNAIPGDRRKAINIAFANVGKSIAAYERRIVPKPGRFDARADGSASLSADEEAGLALFLDGTRTLCLRCHNGPLFTNQGFHNIGTGGFEGPQMDFGRLFGLQAVLMDEFNCLGPYRDGGEEACGHLVHAPRQDVPEEYAGAFKVPGLRNLTLTAPYMHDGRYATLAEVVEHYRHPPPAALASGEIQPVAISDEEARQLVAFLGALDGGYRIE